MRVKVAQRRGLAKTTSPKERVRIQLRAERPKAQKSPMWIL